MKPDLTGDQEARDRRDFFRLATWATSFGLAIMLASVATLQRGAAGLIFVFSAWTVVFFLIGAGLGWGFWHAAIRWIEMTEENDDSSGKTRRSRRQFIVWVGLVLLAGLLCFLFPLKFAVKGQMLEVLEGFGLAVVVLAFVGVLIWRVIRMFEDN